MIARTAGGLRFDVGTERGEIEHVNETSMARTGSSSPTKSSTQSGKSVVWLRSKPSTKRFMEPPHECEAHIMNCLSAHRFHSSSQHCVFNPLIQLASNPKHPVVLRRLG